MNDISPIFHNEKKTYIGELSNAIGFRRNAVLTQLLFNFIDTASNKFCLKNQRPMRFSSFIRFLQ